MVKQFLQIGYIKLAFLQQSNSASGAGKHLACPFVFMRRLFDEKRYFSRYSDFSAGEKLVAGGDRLPLGGVLAKGFYP